MKQRNPRPSATDRFIACASSVVPAEAPHEPDSMPARAGSAVHHAIWLTIKTGKTPDLAEVARSFDVEDEAHVTVPFALWRRAWEVLRQYFPEPEAEVRVEGPLNSGTLDLLSTGDDRMTFADWKSGWGHGSHEYQLASYAHALRAVYGMPAEGVIRGAVVHLRHEYWKVFEFNDARLDAFERRYRQQLDRVGEHYAAGEQCMFCPRQLECKTRAAFIRSSIASISDAVDTVDAGELDARKLVGLHSNSKAVEAMLGKFKAALRLAVAAGPVPMGDGLQLQLQERHTQSIDARAAWPILREHLNDDELAAAMSITKKPVLDAVRARAPRGQKGKAAERLIETLKAKGAIRESMHTVLQVSKAKGEK